MFPLREDGRYRSKSQERGPTPHQKTEVLRPVETGM